MQINREERFATEGGIGIRVTTRPADYEKGTSPWIDRLDAERGAVFSSSYEYPGRYTRWDMALVNPPLVLESRAREVSLTALNDRGRLLLPAIRKTLDGLSELARIEGDDTLLEMTVAAPTRAFSEEMQAFEKQI